MKKLRVLILQNLVLHKYRVFHKMPNYPCCLSLHVRVVVGKEILQNTLEEKSVQSKNSFACRITFTTVNDFL